MAQIDCGFSFHAGSNLPMLRQGMTPVVIIDIVTGGGMMAQVLESISKTTARPARAVAPQPIAEADDFVAQNGARRWL